MEDNTTETRMMKSMHSTISSLKEIVTIVAGLTITNAIVQIVSTTSIDGIPSIRVVNINALLLFIILIINVIRFYHGNIRHLDSAYTLELGKGSSGDLNHSGGKNIGIDFLIIFVQSLIFAILSFIIKNSTEFFFIFTILLTIDIIWFVGIYQLTTEKDAFSHQKKWTINNLVFVILLWIFISQSINISSNINFYILSSLICINTIIDFVISWNFYFPSYKNKTV
jgi:hypothetical protein